MVILKNTNPPARDLSGTKISYKNIVAPFGIPKGATQLTMCSSEEE